MLANDGYKHDTRLSIPVRRGGLLLADQSESSTLIGGLEDAEGGERGWGEASEAGRRCGARLWRMRCGWGARAGCPGCCRPSPGGGGKLRPGGRAGWPGPRAGGGGGLGPGLWPGWPGPACEVFSTSFLSSSMSRLNLARRFWNQQITCSRHGFLVTIKRYRVLMFNIDALSHRKQPV